MPDREKVIKGLERISEWLFQQYRVVYDGDAPNYYDAYKTVDDAIALLKEQETKQIVRIQCKKENADGSIDYFAEWHCPHCNMLILRGFDNPSIKFCYKCGKPILWEGR